MGPRTVYTLKYLSIAYNLGVNRKVKKIFRSHGVILPSEVSRKCGMNFFPTRLRFRDKRRQRSKRTVLGIGTARATRDFGTVFSRKRNHVRKKFVLYFLLVFVQGIFLYSFWLWIFIFVVHSRPWNEVVE